MRTTGSNKNIGGSHAARAPELLPRNNQYISRIDLSAKMDSLKHEQKELEHGKKSTDIIMNQEQDDKSKDKKKERE